MNSFDLLTMLNRPLEHPVVLLPFVFIVGALVGSMLNVCILRMPLEKSILWPSSHCGNCLRPIRWRDNIPILSYLLLGGKCRNCGTKFSSRYFWIELGTAALFTGLFWYYMTLGQQAATDSITGNLYRNVPKVRLALWWLVEVIFLCFLIVATFTDIDHREIPLRLTVTGTILGLIGGTLFPWPWPLQPAGNHNFAFGGMNLPPENIVLLPLGLQPWPFWLPTPSWIPPGSWQMGLVTAVLGALAGTGLIRGIRLVFGWGFRKEAMGLGDADLMMMIGAFLGWQAIALVLIYAVMLGMLFLFFSVIYLILFNKRMFHELAFGPFLAGGAALTLYGPLPFFVVAQRLFFDLGFVLAIVILGLVLSFTMAFVIRLFRLIRLAT
jgi:leader peptidase (prepilin peptidase)/N-methyltransferase